MKTKIEKVLYKWHDHRITSNEAVQQIINLFTDVVVIDSEKNKHKFATLDNGAPCYTCPKCNESDVCYEDNYCTSCGVKLEWN